MNSEVIDWKIDNEGEWITEQMSGEGQKRIMEKTMDWMEVRNGMNK